MMTVIRMFRNKQHLEYIKERPRKLRCLILAIVAQMPFGICRGYSDENKSDFLRGLTLTGREVEPRLGGAADVPKGDTRLPGPYAHQDSSEASGQWSQVVLCPGSAVYLEAVFAAGDPQFVWMFGNFFSYVSEKMSSMLINKTLRVLPGNSDRH